EAHPLAHHEVLKQPQIHIFKTGVVDQVANTRLMGELSFRRLRPFQSAARTDRVAVRLVERIDPPIGVGVAPVVSHRLLIIERCVVEHPEFSYASRQAAIIAHTPIIGAPADVRWKSRLELDQAADLPSAEDLAAQVLSPEERQLVEEVGDENV